MKVVTYLGSLVQLCCGERGTLQKKKKKVACVGIACSVWTTLGLPQLTAVCTFWVYTAQAAGYSAGALSNSGPAFHALPRSKPLRFLGALQGHRPRWAVVLCPSQVQAAQPTWCLVSTLSQVSHVSYHLPDPDYSVSWVCHKGTVTGVPFVSSGKLISGCDPLGGCQPSRIPGRHG